MFQKGNVDKKTGKCCSGVRSYGSNDCWDFMDNNGIHWYSCDVSGNNGNQQYRFTEDGHIEVGSSEFRKKAKGTCMFMDPKGHVQKQSCSSLSGDSGIFEQIYSSAPEEWKLYQAEIARHRYASEFPDLLDN